MLRPPPNLPMQLPPSSSPPPKLPRLSLSLSLLPSERAALGLHSPLSPRSDTPPPLPSVPATPPIPRTTSRNDLFSVNWSPETPNVSSRSASPAPLPNLSISSQSSGYTTSLPPSPPSSDLTYSRRRRPSCELPITPTSPTRPSGWPKSIPIPTEDRWMDPASSPTLRLSTAREFQLGEGRHASVFLASYRPPDTSEWKLCAAKRALPDRESQVASLDEAAVLARLGGRHSHPNIIKLLGVKDERDPGIDLVVGTGVSRRSSTSFAPPSRSHRSSLSTGGGGSTLAPPLGSPSIESEASTFASPKPIGSRERVRREKTKVRYSEPPPRQDLPVSVDSAENSPRVVLVLEYCPFGHVLAFAKAHPERLGRKRWLAWAKELVGAVAWAHERGVLHADIKPQNVLITSDLSLRLSDFGMSLLLPSTPPTDPIGLGTPSYSSPEFVRGAPSPFGFPSDVFSLGVTLSVLLSSIEPFSGLRTVERMFKVAQGGYWDWSERRRLGAVGDDESRPPSRAGSVQGLSRQSSVRSRANSLDEQDQDVMSDWTRDALVARLLVDEDGSSPDRASFILPRSPTLEDAFDDAMALEDQPYEGSATYPDGTPVQYFLDGGDVVDREIRELLWEMTRAEEGERPSAGEVLRRLEEIA